MAIVLHFQAPEYVESSTVRINGLYPRSSPRQIGQAVRRWPRVAQWSESITQSYLPLGRMPSFGQLALYGLTLAFPLAILYQRLTADSKPTAKPAAAPQGEKTEKKSSIMQPERTDLDPPKNDPFTQEQLKAYDGSDPSKPVYVAIKGSSVRLSQPHPLLSLSLSHSGAYANTCVYAGTVFDVSRKRETYGPGGSYAILAGKDGSRALGLSSLNPEDAVADWSTLQEKDRRTLDEWLAFFTCVSFSRLVFNFVVFGY